LAQRRSRRGNTNARKRSSAGTKRNADAAARGSAAADEKARIRLEIISIVLIAVGAFLLFALFTEASGKVGDGLDNVLSGLFGPMAGALPFFLIAYGVLLVIGIVRGANLRRSILIAAVFILFCILLAGRYIDIVGGEAIIIGRPDISLVFSGSAAGSGGGVVGTYIALALVGLIGKPGLYILCIALICISGILLAGMSMAMATRVVREKTISAREERQKRQDERRALYAEDNDRHNDFAAEPMAGSGRQAPIQVPSFLGGSNENNNGGDKQQKIIDAVKNDEVYGDHSRPRGLVEIEDTTVPFKPDTPRRSVPLSSDEAMGKQKADAMHYGTGQDDSHYSLPPLDLLSKSKGRGRIENTAKHEASAAKLEQALRDFRVEARVVKVTVGPTVTRYEVEPDLGVKIQSIRSLEPDLALKLEVESVRVVPLPRQSVIGIEAYNTNMSIVPLRELIDSEDFRDAPSSISFALGKNIAGKNIIVDLREMPHLLIAGTTGSGKSVCINSILLSILYRAKPSEVKLILIDPKVVELKGYNDIPHLLLPVVTDPERAAMALSYAVTIMGERYKKFDEHKVRTLEGYNAKMRKEGHPEEAMPQIVIVIDELSDLMMIASQRVQDSITRLAQMARAAGMHLIVATQQPLASILTSVIKANIPSRIAFAVSSNSASRVILDNPGAGRLHGKGDMLFSPLGTREAIRVQGAFADENEVIKVVNHIKKQMDPDYSVEVMTQVNASVAGNLTDDEDELFLDAVRMVVDSKTDPKQVSVSMLQRRFRIGYNRAARLVDMMEERGIVAASDGTNKPRRLIMGDAQLAGFLASAGQVTFDDSIYTPEEPETSAVTFDSLEALEEKDWDEEDDEF